MALVFDFGKSRMCPTDATTLYLPSKYFEIVLALAGDSTINNYMVLSIT
jgi:hypothetical protein